jgi:hypothetical protein
MLTEKREKELSNRFHPHTLNTEQALGISQIQMQCYELSKLIVHLVPDGDEQRTALVRLEEVMFFSNAGIARGD